MQTLTYTYWKDDQLKTANASSGSGAGTITDGYDKLGRHETRQDANGVTLTFGYNKRDDRTSVTDSQGGSLSSVYDRAHRLEERTLTATGAATQKIKFTYSDRDQVTKVERFNVVGGNPVLVSSTDKDYDFSGRLKSLIHKDGAGATLFDYGYDYDHADRITLETRNGTPKSYGYDANSRLTSDAGSGLSYDKNDNRTMAGYATGPANRIISDGTWTYTPDAEGNVTKKSKGATQETWTYGYDHNNRLLWVEQADTDGGQRRLRVDYGYDALSNQIFDKVDEYSAGGILLSSVTTKHVFDGSQILADLDVNNVITTRYLLGDITGERFARLEGAAGYFLLQDRLGSVREVLNLSGTVASIIAYDAFGKVLSETDSTKSGNHLFTGLLYLRAISLYGTPNRIYDPVTGRFRQGDFIGFQAGLMNLYSYTGNNPTNATDLSGLQGEDAYAKFVKAYAKSNAPPPPSGKVLAFKGRSIDCFRCHPDPATLPKHTPGAMSSIGDDLRAVGNFLDEEIYQPGKRTVQLGHDLWYASDPEFRDFKSERARKFFLTKEAGYGETWLGATADATNTVVIGVPAVKTTVNVSSKAVSKSIQILRSAEAGLAAEGKMAIASAPGAQVTIQGVQARELSRRLTTTEMAAIQRNSGREAAQIYLTGPGKNGGGGTYYLLQGTKDSVSIPLGSNVRWINHTHPALYPSGAPVPLIPSQADRNVLRLLQQYGSPQRTSQVVPETGKPFLFRK